jgi:glycosyltransferase involved in cell wall biosynthesis
MSHSKGRIRSLVQFCLRRAGKGDRKVSSVFGVNAEASHRAVLYLREGAPEIPVWLFTTTAPLPETAALCERIYLNTNPFALVAVAESRLWERWVAISVATWVGGSDGFLLKLAPFFTPPFRVLILNKDGGFFSGSPGNVGVHCARAGWDSVQAAWAHLREAAHDFRVRAKEAIDRGVMQTKDALRRVGIRKRDLLGGFSRLSEATGLLLLSRLLSWTANPHLKVFRRLHGNQPLLLDLPPSRGGGVLRFPQRGHQGWDGDALEKLARASDARWVLWQCGEDDTPDEGLPLFEDDRTFAVSRQTHFRGWKPFLLATAPFRALQPNEASRVLAPLGSTLLVDRAKLLALGIPRCNMPGTAWLILFWKAAAAGFRSYSLGQNAAVVEQPEYPIQDAAFFLSAFSDSALRRLCPRQDDLSRGNIAFAPALQRRLRESSERLKVLIVSPFLPYPLSHGGAVRIFNLCRELSDRVDFSLIAMREAKDVVDYAKLHEVFDEVHVVDRDLRPVEDPKLPAQVSASESTSLRALISQLSEKLLPDLIQIEYSHFAGFRDSAPGVPALLVEHDLTFSLYRQLAEADSNPAAWNEYNRWLAFERKWLNAFEGVWTVSQDDRLRAVEEGRRAANRTFAIANGVDIERFRPSDADPEEEVFYVGSFRHLPNIIGFEILCREVMPRVWAKAPWTRLRVVGGPDHEFFWQKFGRKENLSAVDPRIQIHGFVEDLRPFYARASAVAVPLEVSAGTNIKVLEAMACGKAIVSTPVGCAGLGLHDEYHLLVRENWEEFSDAVCDLLAKPALRSGLGRRARRAAEDSFSWKAVAEGAYESYLAIARPQTPDLARSVSVATQAVKNLQPSASGTRKVE